jgi:hypothetical protein
MFHVDDVPDIERSQRTADSAVRIFLAAYSRVG